MKLSRDKLVLSRPGAAPSTTRDRIGLCPRPDGHQVVVLESVGRCRREAIWRVRSLDGSPAVRNQQNSGTRRTLFVCMCLRPCCTCIQGTRREALVLYIPTRHASHAFQKDDNDSGISGVHMYICAYKYVLKPALGQHEKPWTGGQRSGEESAAAAMAPPPPSRHGFPRATGKGIESRR